jgi:hypothetical protein
MERATTYISAHDLRTVFRLSDTLRQCDTLYNTLLTTPRWWIQMPSQQYQGRQAGACCREVFRTGDGGRSRERKLHLIMGGSSSIPLEVVATSGSVVGMRFGSAWAVDQTTSHTLRLCKASHASTRLLGA